MLAPEIAVAIVGAFSVVTVAFVQRSGAMARDVRETREQVQNSHGTNLRDDLDAMHHTILSVLRSVEGLHEDTRVASQERKAISARMSHHLDDCNTCQLRIQLRKPEENE